MNSSGIKRGLAVSAISALAVAGIPALADTASATTVASTLTATGVELYSPSQTPWVSTKGDGTNTTVSLTAGGGSSVTSILFQYRTTSSAGAWIDVPGGLVARNSDGVFTFDWSNPPADLVEVQAVSNVNTTDNQVVGVSAPSTTETVELATEGALGVFLSPYAAGDDFDGVAGADNKTGQYIIADGTTSGATTGVTITQVSHEGQTNQDAVSTNSVDADGTGSGTTGAFAAVMDITGYVASGGGDANQLALNAKTTSAAQNTDDAEGSTLYNQTITTVTATPETQDSPGTGGAPVKVVVLDQNGQPVANAQVGTYRPDGADAGTDPDDAGTVKGYTDAKGEITITQAFNGTVTYYANTTDSDPYEAATDPSDTATVNQYTPVVSQVVIKSRGDRTAFDLDELLDGDEFTIETRDQKGNLYNEDGNVVDGDASEVEYRWVIDPADPAAATRTEEWQTDAVDTGSKFTVPALTDADYNNAAKFPGTTGGDLPAGTYTLEARRPNVGLSGGLVNATPVTYTMGESEITFADGAAANAPVNGSFTATGTLALTGTGGPGLAGRLVPITYSATGDSRIAPQSEQPAGVTVTDATHATAVTGTGGSFSIKLTDPAVPANVTPTPETGTLNAGPAQEGTGDASSLSDTNGPGAADVAASDATGSLTINWRVAPVVTDIQITANTLDPRDSANAASTATSGPGVPVDLDITVFQADGSDADTLPDPAGDVPVEVSVDKGFLSPNAETAKDVTLAAGHDATGDLWGFFKNDGTSKTLQSGDTGAGTGKTGIVAAIERDAGFDDDGLVQLTVTVKSGSVTKTQTITMDSSVLTNMGEASLDRAAGEPTGDVTVPGEVDFQLYTHDQFGNLAREFARISDDSTVADFRTDGDFDGTESDYTTSGPGITAFSDAPTVQTLTATMQPGQVTVDASDDPVPGAKTTTTHSDPINWVAATPPPPVPAGLTLRGGDNGAADDSLLANAIGKTEGATVKLFRKRADGTWKFLQKGVMNSKGNYRFDDVADLNGNKVTRYKAIVKATALTNRGVGKKKVR